MRDGNADGRNIGYGRRWMAAVASALVIVAAMAGTGGCRRLAQVYLGEPEPGPVTRVTPTQSGQVIDIREGHRLAAHLPDHREGVRWTLVRAPEGRVLRYDAEAGERETVAGWEHAVEYFTGTGPGITSLRFEARGAEGREAADVLELTVRVTY